MTTRYLVLYTPAADAGARIAEHFPAHQEHFLAFHAAGTLLGIGTFGDPRQGAMGMFTSREAAEDFVARDPFMAHGIVAAHEIREWQDVLS